MVFDLICVHNFHGQMFIWSKYDLVFGVDMSSSVHVDDRKKDILVLGEGLMQGLDNTTI